MIAAKSTKRVMWFDSRRANLNLKDNRGFLGLYRSIEAIIHSVNDEIQEEQAIEDCTLEQKSGSTKICRVKKNPQHFSMCKEHWD